MSKDNSSSGGFTAIFVVAMIAAVVICGSIGIDSIFLTLHKYHNPYSDQGQIRLSCCHIPE